MKANLSFFYENIAKTVVKLLKLDHCVLTASETKELSLDLCDLI